MGWRAVGIRQRLDFWSYRPLALRGIARAAIEFVVARLLGARSATVLKRRWEAGSRPGGRGTFLCITKEKSPKERRPHVCDPCAARRGKPASRFWRGGPQELASRLQRFAQTTSASQFTKRVHAALHAPPRQNHAAGAASRGVEQPLGPSLRSALGPRRVALARWGPSAAMARLVFPPLWTCREAQSGRWVRAAQHARASCSDSLQLLERRCAAAKRVLQRHRTIEHRRLPHRNAMGTRPVGSPFFGFFLWRVKERSCAAGRTSRPHTAIKRQRQMSDQPKNYKFNSCPRNQL